MNPPDSPLPPDDLAAAAAAMRREWAEVRAQGPLNDPELAEEDRYEAGVRQMVIFRAFLHRHRAVFAAPELSEQDREPQAATRLLQQFLESNERLQRDQEKALQLNADLADGCRELVLECLRKLAWLEGIRRRNGTPCRRKRASITTPYWKRCARPRIDARHPAHRAPAGMGAALGVRNHPAHRPHAGPARSSPRAGPLLRLRRRRAHHRHRGLRQEQQIKNYRRRRVQVRLSLNVDRC